MVDILVIESTEGDGIIKEIIDFLSSKAQCRVTNYSDVMSSSRILTFPGLDINIREQTVYHNGTLIPMTHHEFFTLLYLAQHPAWVFSKDQIYEHVWKKSGDGGAAVMSVVSQIRRKIGDGYIETVVGSGYRFVG